MVPGAWHWLFSMGGLLLGGDYLNLVSELVEVSYSTVSLDDVQYLSVAYHVCMAMMRTLFVRDRIHVF